MAEISEIISQEFKKIMQNEWKQKVRAFSDLNKFAKKHEIVLTAHLFASSFR